MPRCTKPENQSEDIFLRVDGEFLCYRRDHWLMYMVPDVKSEVVWLFLDMKVLRWSQKHLEPLNITSP